jgi:hypothetical protein
VGEENDVPFFLKVRSAFLASSTEKGSRLDRTDEELVTEIQLGFQEYVEALIRSGVIRYEDPRLSVDERAVHMLKVIAHFVPPHK